MSHQMRTFTRPARSGAFKSPVALSLKVAFWRLFSSLTLWAAALTDCVTGPACPDRGDRSGAGLQSGALMRGDH
eukprot:scaffold58422_cov61-Phaeocystis_antarctica.AAC.2